MTQSLFEAKPFDPRRQRRWRILIAAIGAAIVVAWGLYLWWPYHEARSTVASFMRALVRRNYQEAYFIWQPDPKAYPMDSFMQDWGPSSRWGIIKTYHIDHVMTPPPMVGGSSGLVVLVTINGIPHRARLWVQNKTHSLGFYMGF